MSDVIGIFEESTLKGEKAGEKRQNFKSAAINSLLAVWPEVDESELRFEINDEHFRTNAGESERPKSQTSDTLGSTLRKNLRKMIREINLQEMLQGAAECATDERAARRQSEVSAPKTRKSSTQFADLPSTSRRATIVRSSLEFNVKRKSSATNPTITKPLPSERRASCVQGAKIYGERRDSTKEAKIKSNNLKKERSQAARESISTRSFRTDSLVPHRICNNVDESVAFAISPPSWTNLTNLSKMKNGTWQKNEHTRRKVSSWLTQQKERFVV